MKLHTGIPIALLAAALGGGVNKFGPFEWLLLCLAELPVLFIVRVTTLDGKKADMSNVDLPTVPAKTDLLGQPFVQVVTDMRNRALAKLCK